MTEPQSVARYDEAFPLERAFEALLLQSKQSLANLSDLENKLRAYENRLRADGRLGGVN